MTRDSARVAARMPCPIRALGTCGGANGIGVAAAQRSAERCLLVTLLCFKAGAAVELTVDLGTGAWPSNFRLYTTATPVIAPPAVMNGGGTAMNAVITHGDGTIVGAGGETHPHQPSARVHVRVRVAGSQASAGPFGAIGELEAVACSLSDMGGSDGQHPALHPVCTHDLVVPLASVSARYLRFTVEAGAGGGVGVGVGDLGSDGGQGGAVGTVGAAQLSVAQVEVYE